MIHQPNKPKNIVVLMPVFGILIYVVLYVVATFLYPGGSQASKNAVGFSWANNYWCNLLNDTAINGQPNPAKPIAMAAMFILCLSLAFFWYQFPKQIILGKKLTLCIQVSGALAMAIACLLFTSINHDLVINTASVFGLVAMAITFIGLYKARWFGLFAFGLLNILFVGLNNYFYHSAGLITYLPIVQKISFASFLIWFCCISINLYNKSRLNSYQI